MKKCLAVLAASSWLFCGQLVAETKLAKLTPIVDGVYEYWQDGYNSLVVVGDKGVLVVDTASESRAEKMQQAIAQVTDLAVTHVALSHEHFDHVGGTEVFDQAKVICHISCQKSFSLSPLMPAPEVDIHFEERMTVDLGGAQVELFHPSIADGNGASIIRVLNTGVVFSTDLYMHRQFVPDLFIEHANFVGSRKVINALLDWQPSYAINGHGQGNSLQDLKENAQMYEALYKAVMERFNRALAEGGRAQLMQTLFSISSELQLTQYQHWENYQKYFPAYVKRMALSIIHGG